MQSFASFLLRTPPHAEHQDTQATSVAYWSPAPEQLLAALRTTNGLQPADVAQRPKHYGLNAIRAHQQMTALGLFLHQFKSPLVLILLFGAVVSLLVGEWTDASIVLAVVLGSTVLGFVQESRASNAVEKLRSQVTLTSRVFRGGQPQILPSNQVVPGDVVLLSPGSLIPADGVVLVAHDSFVNQAVLTGETFFMGTSAVSGTAQVLIV